MAWTWSQSAGRMTRGETQMSGYSGGGAGKNNPLMQDVSNVGPIPQGAWTMTGVEQTGGPSPFTIVLVPEAGTQTFGRSGFRIHGDSINAPGAASHGCIILGRPDREAIWASGDHDLSVVA
jgi:hypothetical protein